MLELNRKEAKLRGDMKRYEDERKQWQTSAQERAAKDAERAALDETFKTDAQTLLEHYGWTTEAVIDFLAKGGSSSPEGQIRALRLQIEGKNKADADAKTAADAKAVADAEAAEAAQAKAEATAFVRNECDRLLPDESRFELLAKEQTRTGTPIAVEVGKHIMNRWNNDREDISPEQAMVELESVLDTIGLSLAQSKKLQAKLSGKPAEAEQAANRQPASVPSATNSRTITIKQRQQAVAPIRHARDGRAPRSEISREVAANLASLLK